MCISLGQTSGSLCAREIKGCMLNFGIRKEHVRRRFKDSRRMHSEHRKIRTMHDKAGVTTGLRSRVGT